MTPIDNFDIVKSSLMGFEEKDNLFMHVQVLRRGKDHPDLPAANKLIKSWLVKSAESLDKIKEEVVFLCDHWKARAYISFAPKSLAKLNTLIMLKLADNQHTGNIINPWHVFNSAYGELQGVEKRWVIDVDTKDLDMWDEIELTMEQLWLKAHPQDWGKQRGDTFWIAGIPTLNGVHYIVRPFNLQEFRKQFPDVEAKKNGLTALYVPECITKEKTI
ncbi:MAG: hypothetical protein HDS16_05355 [Bacteroides sp.]|nr:hypothetical protein [Bacteroides sp.]